MRPATFRWMSVLLGIGLASGGLSGVAAADEPGKAADPDAGYAVRLFIAKSDGSEPKPLVEAPHLAHQGSPSWSRDGRLVAFDAWGKTGGNSGSTIYVVNPDGTNLRRLVDGMMPSLSPQGHRIAFSRFSRGRGIWIVNTDVPDEELIQVDETGWGTDWSPDGSRIAFTKHEGGRGNIAIFNIVEGTRSDVFPPGESPYRQISWNFAWSPDGRTIAFRGVREDGKPELAVVNADGTGQGLKAVVAGEVLPAVSFFPDGRVMFSQAWKERENRLQLLTVDPTKDAPPELLPGLPLGFIYSDAAPSPNGDFVVYARKKGEVGK